jgi:hypothetical protein
MKSTLQSVRDAVFGALSSGLVYQVDTGSAYSTATLPAENVVPRSLWLTGGDQAPDPLVCFNVGETGDIGGRQTPGERVVRLRVWCVSKGEDEATFLYEAVRAALNYADQDAIPGGAPDLSRSAASYRLALAVRQIKLTGADPVEYDPSTGRWYVRATFRVNAI